MVRANLEGDEPLAATIGHERQPRPQPRASPSVAPLVLFGATAVVLWLVVALVSGHPISGTRPGPFPGSSFLGGWAYDDGDWYRSIASNGYFYRAGHQSSVAFFPAYPLLMRAGGWLVGDPALAGVLLTLLCGFGVVVLFRKWCGARLSAASTMTATCLLAVYPYAWYLYGAIYSDALFVVAILAAFLLLERDRPIAAGLVAAIATATRPLGPAVVIGLVAVLLQQRGFLPSGSSAIDPDRAAPEKPENPENPPTPATRAAPPSRRTIRPRDAGVLLSVAGVSAYVVYLWVRFDAPLAFAQVQSAPGWNQGQGPHTWFKAAFFGYVLKWHDLHIFIRLLPHALLALGAILLIPLIARRLGWGYALYTAAIVAIPLLGSSNFMGTSRYLLAAFPCFAVVGDLLARRPAARVAVLAASLVALVGLTSLHARGVYLS